jgi:hypothetical protein
MVARSDTTGIRAVDTTGADPCFAVSVLWSISAALRRHRRWPRRPSCDHRLRRLQPRCRCRFSLCQHRNDRAPDLRTRLVRLGERSLTRHALRPDYRRDLVGCTTRFTLVRRAARRHFGLLPGLSAPNVPSLDWRSPLDNCSASPRLTREGSSNSAAVSIERAFLRARSAQPPGSRVIGLRFAARLAADTLCYVRVSSRQRALSLRWADRPALAQFVLSKWLVETRTPPSRPKAGEVNSAAGRSTPPLGSRAFRPEPDETPYR